MLRLTGLDINTVRLLNGLETDWSQNIINSKLNNIKPITPPSMQNTTISILF